MEHTIKVPRWADPITHRGRAGKRFKLYGFSEMCRMTTDEWDKECRRNGADMEEHLEEVYIRECIEARGLKT